MQSMLAKSSHAALVRRCYGLSHGSNCNSSSASRTSVLQQLVSAHQRSGSSRHTVQRWSATLSKGSSSSRAQSSQQRNSSAGAWTEATSTSRSSTTGFSDGIKLTASSSAAAVWNAAVVAPLKPYFKSLFTAMTRERCLNLKVAALPVSVRTNFSNWCGHGSFLMLALAYMESDILLLRAFSASGILLSILFQFYRPQPLWIPIRYL
jgi:hypothetical protein